MRWTIERKQLWPPLMVEANTIYETSGEPIRFNQCGEDSMTWKDNQFGVGH